MGGIHFVGGEKGGVGKSVVSRVLAQYFIDHKVPFVALDGDASHPAMRRYYETWSEPLALTELESMDRIAEHAVEKERRVLVDLPAQSAAFVRTWIESGDVLGFARENEIPVRLWHVTDGGYDSVELLAALVRRYAKDVGYVVVRNHGRSRDFSQLDESEALAEVLALGGHVIDVPELHAAAMYRIDRYGSSFWAAANDESSPLRLAPMDRRRMQRWIKDCYAQLERVGSEL